MDILNKILDDLIKDEYINYTISTVSYEKLELLHFSVGIYIRNKYLWNNSAYLEVLYTLYNTSDVDKISSFIIKHVYFLIHEK